MIKRLLPGVLLLLLVACASVQTSQAPGLKIAHLSEIPHSAYFHYRKYAPTGKVYIMVHPGYYLYYQKRKPTVENSSRELLEFMNQQVQTERQFFLLTKESKQLVILVLPGKRLKKDYIAYINRITMGADNFLYIFSKNRRTGDLPSSEEKTLERFLKAININEVVIGGGYVGRCETRTYRDLLSMKGISIALSPEISFFSPDDISEATVRMVRNPDGSLNISILNRLVQTVFMKHKANLKANIKNLFINNQSLQ